MLAIYVQCFYCKHRNPVVMFLPFTIELLTLTKRICHGATDVRYQPVP